MRNSRRHATDRRYLIASLALAAPLCAAGLVAAPGTAQAQEPASASAAKLVTIDVRDARFEDAVRLLASQTGVSNVVFVNPESKPFQAVTLTMSEQPFDKVLRAVAASAGATVSLEDGIYYLRPRGEEPMPAKVEAAAAPVVVQPARRPGPRNWMKIPLQYLVPSEFVDFVKDPAKAKLLNYENEPVQKPSEVLNPKFPSANPIVPLNVAPSPAAPLPAGPVSPGVAQDGDAAGQRTGGRGFGAGGGGGQGFPGGGGQGFPGGGPQGPGAPGGPGGQGGQQGNASLRPDGVEQIISNDADNSLLVVGDAQGIEELRNLIRLLDVAPKQVQIRAEFVSVSVNDADQFGIDWRIVPAGNLDVFIPPQGGATPTITMAYSSGNAVANMRASLLRNTSNLLQAPIITTTNNRQAFINVQDVTTTFVTVQTVTNVGIVSNTQPVLIPANNFLSVTPHINGDNSISMLLQPTLTSQETFAGPGGNTGIRQQSQTLTTFRRVQNGETMVLGGFITKQEGRQEQRVPILSDLPIIGNLFTQKNRTVTGTEILVFVTPTIIEDRAAGSLGVGGGAPTP
ncbi:MAG TPA: hypothetical protein VM490_12450 [Armatimonadaceae bacterium]|nr:hypothetical protein [Armatimonadaceae bacterium]